MKTRMISIVTPCFNEEQNVQELHERIREVMLSLEGTVDYEHIFIDNASTDRTLEILKQISSNDPRVKIIVNARNFGHIRSPYHAVLQAGGDAVICMASDLQDPPEMVPDFIGKWEEGYKIVVGVKEKSEESPLFFAIRKFYYNLIGRLSEVDLIKNFTGFGLYDREIVEILRQIDDPYPYFRGLICDIGFDRAEIPYLQRARRRGITKNNFYTLYDIAMLGFTNHSKIPLRLATMIGFGLGVINMIVALAYTVYKLLFWNNFSVGIAPVVIGMFFFASVQLFFIGIIGEYIGSIHTQVLKRPLVIEKERINF